jgi:hypothetical protein
MDKTPQEHNWEHRGINPPRSNGGRWEPWIKGLLSFILGVLSAAFLFGGKSRSLDDLLVWKGTAEAHFVQFEEEFKRLHKEGTNRSKWIDESQSKQIDVALSRMAEFERKAETRGEAINVMQVKIEKLERELELIKNRNPK